jgi:hypothetical protein
MKKYIYNFVFEDGTESLQSFDHPIVLSNSETKTNIVVHSLTLSECVDVDNVSVNQEIVVEAEDEQTV